MNCLKCGRETDISHVFCNSCLEVMSQHPVKPDAAVQLPRRALLPDRPPVQKKRSQTPEELLAQARRENRKLRRLVVLLCLVIILGSGLAMLYKFREPIIENVGKNYTIFID